MRLEKQQAISYVLLRDYSMDSQGLFFNTAKTDLYYLGDLLVK